MEGIKNITILFCEGPHDTAFLYRILKTKCYKVFNKRLLDLPNIVGKFIESKNKAEEYDNLKVNVLRNEFLPYRILIKEERLILLYSLGGDKDGSKDENNKRLIILNHFFTDISENVEISGNYGESFTSSSSEGTSYRYNFLFFYDADNDKDEKINITNKYLEKLSLEYTVSHNEIHKDEYYSFGVYIFSDDQDKGALENILFDIMKTGNEEIFNEANTYYDRNFDKDRTRRLVTECVDC